MQAIKVEEARSEAKVEPRFRGLHRFEAVFVVIAFFMFAEGFRDILNPVWNPLRMVIFGVIGILFLLYIKDILYTFLRSPVLVLMYIFAAMSIYWSAERGATIMRVFALTFSTLFAAWFATRYTLKQQIGLLAWVYSLFMFTSLILVLAMPEVGRAGGGAIWEGIFTQKNVLGRNMTIAAIVFLVYPASSPGILRLKFIGYGTAFFFILMANSMTALLILFAATIMYFGYRTFRLGIVPGVAMIFITGVPMLIMAYAAATVDVDDVLIALGRDPSLTGRTIVWERVQTAISERPVLGYGYGAFWNDWGGRFGELWKPTDSWVPGQAHNTYLDMWVNLGIIGVILLVITVVINYMLAINRARTTDTSYDLWPALYMTFLLILSTSESWGLFNDIFWVLYLTIAFSLSGTQGRLHSKVQREVRTTQELKRIQSMSPTWKPRAASDGVSSSLG